jgi:hypothetical protein
LNNAYQAVLVTPAPGSAHPEVVGKFQASEPTNNLKGCRSWLARLFAATFSATFFAAFL